MAERIFKISPKTSFETLAKIKTYDHDTNKIAAIDMVQNGRELENAIDWDQAIMNIEVARGGREFPLKGIDAIAYKVGASVIRYAKSKSIGLGEPQVALLSAVFFAREYSARGKIFRDKLFSLESGELKLETPENIVRIQNAATNLAAWGTVLEAATNEFALFIGEDENTLTVFDALLPADGDNSLISQRRLVMLKSMSRDHKDAVLGCALDIQRFRNSKFVKGN
ncbi:MAG: hypothetical protein ACD_30C00037G0013 [uncultured bacterium]|uniref:Uncharacterized protein n=2 Tax=Candidatus Daviesiibacteriota TaxID=1752718 RepID=A0A1F5K603_9BACT|nr:MAG: hypothetical protein ACD_30C00037G0013 [uncultured bacterium]KKQ16124.1 MAG: hypothetical protein US28_C0005G0039 [Candidatus Daviesbacteria bacterium GW2011_GWA1_36_8]OGE31398.1 MAG: hypothetical protein A3C99_02510 [Candidatus Daviesbacteria bacterium RIFCSPHIGHO2_02_FULL_37_9]OGE36413.1 MAG: hypothetical protein A3E66_04465 [Candidatus Daviesbacteria bacterium RIFCSPHIGHO2_12_FULL_37_16]